MYKSVMASELKSLIGKVNIIDIRKNFLYNLGSIPGSVNISLELLISNPNKYLDKNKEYYIYCSQGTESTVVCSKLSKKGYRVININGGYQSFLSSY